MNGGYFMLTLPGLDLTETDPQSIAGAYINTGLAFASGKPVILYYVEGKGPIPACVSKGEGTAYVIDFLTYSASVASGGTVTVTDLLDSE